MKEPIVDTRSTHDTREGFEFKLVSLIQQNKRIADNTWIFSSYIFCIVAKEILPDVSPNTWLGQN